MAEEGKNIVAKNLLDLQPTAILEFFQITLTDPKTEKTQTAFFHNGSLFGDSVTWQGNKYTAIAMESEGFEMLGDKRLPRPKIKVANQDFLITSLLQNYNDFINAKVVRQKVFLKNIDDVNFDGGNPWNSANATATISTEDYVVGRKVQESKLFVEFELSSPLDVESFNVNDRAIVANYCFWQYRGQGCRYEGMPIETQGSKAFKDAEGNAVTPTYRGLDNSQTSFYNDINAEWNPDTEYIKGDIVYIKGDLIPHMPISDDKISAIENLTNAKTVFVSVINSNSGIHPNEGPSFWQKDVCGKSLSACRKRFNLDNQFTYVREDLQLGSTGFNTMSFLGNKFIDQGDTVSSAGLFTSTGDITGYLTGDFTAMIWVSGNSVSSSKSAILSTTTRDNQFDYFNLSRLNSQEPSKINDVQFTYHGYNPYNIGDHTFNKKQIVGSVDSDWDCYFISNQIHPPNAADGTELTVFTITKPNTFFSAQSTPVAERGSFLPETFTIGGINLGGNSGHASLNGSLGPCALWKRKLTTLEQKYLIHNIYTPNKDTIDFIPRHYYELTGEFEKISGDGNLIAWWDMTTGTLPSSSATGLKDLHENNIFLTGSGVFETGSFNVSLNNEELISNPSYYYPRFAGFPGTDGFGYT
tara:strand:- start:7833 stop:9752 length:1920 start_codon:yes stop_codon:yes gene_type:complete